MVLDNSDDRDPFRVVARLTRGQVTWKADRMSPELVDLLGT